jgi:drug/metabolite transporter (DMT)-like permease
MLIVTLLWSTAGVVTRLLESARSFEVTFWRSFSTLIALGLYFLATRRGAVFAMFRDGGPALLVSGVMWSLMFTCFMLALTLTSVANVLITMSLAPLFTALLAHLLLGAQVAVRTWISIVLAGAGIAWMYAHGISAEPGALLGTLVALCVPIAAAVNWITLQRNNSRRGAGGGQVDLMPALLIGAFLSCLISLPFAWPMQASAHDVAWLAGLGIFQLAVPCMMAVRLARGLSAPELALLSLLEVVFGIGWAWLGAGERPLPQVLAGGTLVLLTLAVNEAIGLMKRRA